MHEQCEEIILTILVTVFHFLKIHRKVLFGNTTVMVPDMSGIAPKSLAPVDMMLAFVGKGFAVVQLVILAQPFQRVS